MKTKEINFRIVELSERQVLISKDFNDDEEPQLSLTFFIGGNKITQTLTFDNELNRDTLFNEVSDDEVRNLMSNNIFQILTDENK